MASKETSQVARNQNRGIKRPRGAPGGTSAHHKPTDFGDPNSLLGPQEATSSAETQSRDAAMSDEETVQPLSKRINRLNIDYPSTAGRISPPEQGFPEQGQADHEEPPSEQDFSHVYPYGPDSPYFHSNQLLRDLYLQREMRIQQQNPQNVRPRLYGCSTPSVSGASFQHHLQ